MAVKGFYVVFSSCGHPLTKLMFRSYELHAEADVAFTSAPDGGFGPTNLVFLGLSKCCHR